MRFWKLAGFLLMLAVAVLSSSTVIAGGPGSGPDAPLRITNDWQTISAGTSLWFYFDYPGDRSSIIATLEDFGLRHVQLAIYTPEQAKVWAQDTSIPPIGLATVPSETAELYKYDLTWNGSFNISGRYFVVVTNFNSFPMIFRLNVRGSAVTLSPASSPTPVPTPFGQKPPPVGAIQGKLVFQEGSGGNIYRVNGDDSNLTRLTYGLDPAWSPDGRQVAFTRWGAENGVYVINSDGTNEHGLVGGVSQPLSPQFSPNGRQVVFSRQSGGTMEDQTDCYDSTCFTTAASPRWKLAVIELADNSFKDIPSSNFPFTPSFAGDNATIVYADNQYGIVATNIIYGNVWLLYNQTNLVQSTRFSPDGTKIAFSTKKEYYWEIRVANKDGSNPSIVTPYDPLAFRQANNVAPVWSPDSKQLLFLSDRNGKWEFFVADLDGLNVKQVLKTTTDRLPIVFNFQNERAIDWVR